MNKIGIEEKQKMLFNELRAINGNVIDDGVVSEHEFVNAKYKIIYVMKEANGGDGWSLCGYLKEGGRSQTWNNIARWTEAILSSDDTADKPWEYWEQNNDERRKEYLTKICVVNLKKTSGGCISDNKEIYDAAVEQKRFLNEQMCLYRAYADFIVCCGTEEAYISSCYTQKPEWQRTSRGIWYFVENDIVTISFAHPEARINDCFLLYALIDAIREIKAKKGHGVVT